MTKPASRIVAVIDRPAVMDAVADDLLAKDPLASERIAGRWLRDGAATIRQLIDRCNKLEEMLADTQTPAEPPKEEPDGGQGGA